MKFTAAGEVAVHVRQLRADDGQGRCVLEFRVTDTGIGIAPERASALFEAFTQVDASTTRQYGGTGLGLAICKRLVELMGGEIGVDSAPGQGSTFWFTMAAPVTELPQALGVIDAGLLSGTRVLVVDDHATNVRILTRQLQLWGMEVDRRRLRCRRAGMAGADQAAAGRDHHRHAHARDGRRGAGPRDPRPAGVAGRFRWCC